MKYRLILYCWFQYLLPIGLLIYGWSSYFKVHWFVPIMGTFVFGFGAAILFVLPSNNRANLSPQSKITLLVTLNYPFYLIFRSFYYLCSISSCCSRLPPERRCHLSPPRRSHIERYSRTWLVISHPSDLTIGVILFFRL